MKFDDIKNIFYINLNKRTDRKQHFESQMKLVGWNATRFNAIENNIGALGCSLSHLALLRYAKANKLDHILIMEDDITFLQPAVFKDSLQKFLESGISFDVLLIAGNNMGDYNRINQNCVKVTHCQTTTGYLVREHYYDKLIYNYETSINLLQKYITNINEFTIDQYWGHLQRIDRWYLLTPLNVIQRPDISDIEKRHTNYKNVMLDLDKADFRVRKNLSIKKANMGLMRLL